MRLFLGLCLVLLLNACAATLPEFEKINGVSYVASRDSIAEKHVLPLVDIYANYAAVMPFGFIKSLDHPEVIFNTERQWFGETLVGTKHYINELRRHNIKAMIKPQIWVWRGEFTGNIKMTTEKDWKILEKSYTDFILTYAKLSEDLRLELFCIGTELQQFVSNRPTYWNELILKIREVYTGKLTYAANWDEFKRTPFWNKLDYIGVDAYFPVSEKETPTIEDCKNGWKTHLDEIKDVVKDYNKPILFTEFGYRSVNFAGKEPWVSDRSLNAVNLEAQTNAMQALFETFWDQPWFAGGFVWKWFHRHDEVGGKDNFMFTPQNKPAQRVIKSVYSSY